MHAIVQLYGSATKTVLTKLSKWDGVLHMKMEADGGDTIVFYSNSEMEE